MIALATPFGEYVQAGVESTLVGLDETKNVAFEIVQPPSPPSSFIPTINFGYSTSIASPVFFAEDVDDMMSNLMVLSDRSYVSQYRESFVPNQIVTFKTDLLKEKVCGDVVYAKFKYSNGIDYIVPLTKDGADVEEEFENYSDHLFVNAKMDELDLPADTSSIEAYATAITGNFADEYTLTYTVLEGLEGWVYQDNATGSAVMVIKNAKTEIDEDGWAGDIVPEEGSAIIAVMGAVGGTLPIHKITVVGKEFIVNEKPTADDTSSVNSGVYKIDESYHNRDQVISFYYNATTDGTSYEVSEGNCAFVWETNMSNIAETMVEGLESIELLGAEFTHPFAGITKSLKNGWIFTPQVTHIFNITPLYGYKENVSKCVLSFSDSSQIEFSGIVHEAESLPDSLDGYTKREYDKDAVGKVYGAELTNDGLYITADLNAPKLTYITIYETVEGKTIENSFQMVTPRTAKNLIEVPQGVGKTHPTYVVETYYPATNTIKVTKNGANSDGKMISWSSPGAQAPNFNGCMLKYANAATVKFEEGITSIGTNTEWSDAIADIYLPISLASIPANNLPKSATYHVHEGSYAETYLAENGYTYVLV
jgi:hypothetical protein